MNDPRRRGTKKLRVLNYLFPSLFTSSSRLSRLAAAVGAWGGGGGGSRGSFGAGGVLRGPRRVFVVSTGVSSGKCVSSEFSARWRSFWGKMSFGRYVWRHLQSTPVY